MTERTEPTPMTPALMTAKQAARHLGVSKAYFEAKVRPYICSIDMRPPGGKKPMPRWEVSELVKLIDSRKRSQKARAVA